MTTVVLILIALLALHVADVLAFGVVMERWLALRKARHVPAFNRDKATPVTDWTLSDQRHLAKKPGGSLWCYYFRKDCSI